jgi:hypothetical protein
MIGFIALYTSTARNYRQYSPVDILHTFQFTVTHTLGFSVFTSRILVTDLSQSHCHFKSHMESSSQSLVPILAIILQLPIPKTRLNSIPSSYLGRLASRNSTLHFPTRLLFSTAENFLITTLHVSNGKHNLYC